MMVTRRTLPKTDWSQLHSNASYDLSSVNGPPVAVVGAVSREMGLELVMTFPKSVNVKKFKVFLEELRRRNPFDNMIIVMDNLAVHRNRLTIERLNDLHFRWAWTPRYSPMYNGIEEVWAMSK